MSGTKRDTLEGLSIHELRYLKGELVRCFGEADIERLEHHRSHRAKEAEETHEQVELFENFNEFFSQSSEITRSAGELAERSQLSIHAAEGASKSLAKTGGVGTLVAGILGLFTVPLLCFLQKRRPSWPEIGQMALSVVTIVLGALAIAAVGGPIGAGVFILAGTVIGLGRTAFGFYNESQERKKLEVEIRALEEKLEDCDKREDQQGLKETLKEYAKNASRLHVLNKLRSSHWELGKKGIYTLSGVMAVVGATLSVIPVTAPIGIALMLVASALAATTIIGSLVVGVVKNYQANQQRAKVHGVKEAQKENLKQCLDELKKSPKILGDTKIVSSEYTINARLVSTGQTVKQALESERGQQHIADDAAHLSRLMIAEPKQILNIIAANPDKVSEIINDSSLADVLIEREGAKTVKSYIVDAVKATQAGNIPMTEGVKKLFFSDGDTQAPAWISELKKEISQEPGINFSHFEERSLVDKAPPLGAELKNSEEGGDSDRESPSRPPE